MDRMWQAERRAQRLQFIQNAIYAGSSTNTDGPPPLEGNERKIDYLENPGRYFAEVPPLFNDAEQEKDKRRKRHPDFTPTPVTPKRNKTLLNKYVIKDFDDAYLGKIVELDSNSNWLHIIYSDGDSERVYENPKVFNQHHDEATRNNARYEKEKNEISSKEWEKLQKALQRHGYNDADRDDKDKLSFESLMKIIKDDGGFVKIRKPEEREWHTGRVGNFDETRRSVVAVVNYDNGKITKENLNLKTLWENDGIYPIDAPAPIV